MFNKKIPKERNNALMEISTVLANYTTVTQMKAVLEVLTAAMNENRKDIIEMCLIKYNELKDNLN